MKKWIRTAVVVAVAVTAFGCATQFAGVASLRGADTAAPDVAPDIKNYAGKRPGGGQSTIARTFREQPPLVPHATDKFDEITVEENQCMDCHSPEAAPKKNAPQVADSHLNGKAVRMERYQCNSCHVPQVDAPPLVTNSFVGTPVPDKR